MIEATPDLKAALGLSDRALPISTLRGQFVDNREWLDDPTLPAIVVGTIDMVGSRLLFEGYGVSAKMRPYHAGMLGADTLVMLDEAHLVPPFEAAIETVARGVGEFGPVSDEHRALVPRLRLLSLSATGRHTDGATVTLDESDEKHPACAKRLRATKKLQVKEGIAAADLSKELAKAAWQLSDGGSKPLRCIVFCDRREDAEKVCKELKQPSTARKKKSKSAPEPQVELFVGGRRTRERDDAAKRLRELGFVAGSTRSAPDAPSFLVATSAGEVGVDLDADVAVMDLVAWERMIQRLGRVNRQGGRDATVVVCVLDLPEGAKKSPYSPEDYAAWRRALNDLVRRGDETGASPATLRAMKKAADADSELASVLEAATTRAPLRPALTRAVVDAWSLTSLREHPGRPEVAPWLRGWLPNDPPQTTVVWRRVLRPNPQSTLQEIEAYFEAAPPHRSEELERETYAVADWLLKRVSAKIVTRSHTETSTEAAVAEEVDETTSDETSADEARNDDDGSEPTDAAEAVLPPDGEKSAVDDDLVGVVLAADNRVLRILRKREIVKLDPKKARDWLEKALADTTLVVYQTVAGLKDGMLDKDCGELPVVADGITDGQDWIKRNGSDPVVRFRVREVAADAAPEKPDEAWRPRFRAALESNKENEVTRWLVVDKWRTDAATEDDRSAAHPQLLDEHQEWTERKARGIAERLSLPPRYREALALAGRLHDEGKATSRWQRAFNAKTDGVYAKTLGPVKFALLDGYRHEFGSIPRAETNARFKALEGDLRDLVLHLVAAHHGFARPWISTRGAEGSAAELAARAEEVAIRFTELQKRWGPWGLAWWEALLRAADQQASRENDKRAEASR
jgi:CRISPR-associated endonuclease/helicase Cas3